MDDYYGNTEAERYDNLADDLVDLAGDFIKDTSKVYSLVRQPHVSTAETSSGVKLTIIVEYGLEQDVPKV